MSLKAFEKWFDESGEDDHLYSYMLNSWQAALEHRESEGMRDHKKPAAQEPAAWAVFAESGNIRIWCADSIQAQTLRIKYGDSLQPLYAAPPAAPDVSGLVEAASTALAEIESLMQEAHNNAYPVCCGRPGSECCGSPEPEWSEADQRTMDRLAPHQRSLTDALSAYREKRA